LERGEEALSFVVPNRKDRRGAQGFARGCGWFRRNGNWRRSPERRGGLSRRDRRWWRECGAGGHERWWLEES
jgi:hypothetical protein